ncbi:YciI family protein [Angustibacter aerolatus]
MKYVVMFTSTPDLDARVTPEQREETHHAVYRWFETHRSSLAAFGEQLQPVATATTVAPGDGGPVVVDGPFSEAKEVVGGFSVLDVPDLDAALAVVREWPMLALPGNKVELRPVVDHSALQG